MVTLQCSLFTLPLFDWRHPSLFAPLPPYWGASHFSAAPFMLNREMSRNQEMSDKTRNE
jgi:hypothetical protein